MAKKKTNRRSKRKSDAKISAIKESPEKVNPFELKHEIKRKHNVIGKTTMRPEKGFPGLSKLKGIEKRKKTLLKDYLKIKKSNKFVDKRIGENEGDLSLEDKMLARFAAERQKQRKDSGILNDEEELTHFGHNLASIEKFDDPRSDDEDEQDRLSDDFVSNAHFGGFLVKKDEKSSAKTRDMLIAEIVTKSKERKELRQKEKEASEIYTDQLNEDWKSVQNLLSFKKKDDDDSQMKRPPLDYDILVRELKFEARAQATTPLKTLEKLAEKQKKQEKIYEEMLLKRMAIVDPAEKKIFKHRSADDLDDDFVLDCDIDDSKDKVIKSQQEEEDEEEIDIEESNETNQFEVVNDEEILEAIDNFISACRKENSLLSKLPVNSFQKSTSETVQDSETNDVLMLNANKNPLENLFQALKQLVDRSPVTSAKMVLELLKGKRNQFLKIVGKKSLKKNILFDMIMLYKVVGLLYPTSDFRHPVTNVLMLFMAEALLKLNVNLRSHVFIGIYICWLFSQFTCLSKRYVPEMFVFLFTLLDSLTNKIVVNTTDSTAVENTILLALDKCLSLLIENLKGRNFLFYDKNSDKLRSKLLKLQQADFPSHLKDNINSLKLLIENSNFKRKKLVRQNIRKYNVKMLDPKLKDFDNKKRISEKQLVRKHQSETKGAMREIRKDNRFLASQRLREQYDKDKANKRKLKELLNNVSEESGYYKKKARKGD